MPYLYYYCILVLHLYALTICFGNIRMRVLMRKSISFAVKVVYKNENLPNVLHSKLALYLIWAKLATQIPSQLNNACKCPRFLSPEFVGMQLFESLNSEWEKREALSVCKFWAIHTNCLDAQLKIYTFVCIFLWSTDSQGFIFIMESYYSLLIQLLYCAAFRRNDVQMPIPNYVWGDAPSAQIFWKTKWEKNEWKSQRICLTSAFTFCYALRRIPFQTFASSNFMVYYFGHFYWTTILVVARRISNFMSLDDYLDMEEP